MKEYIVSERLLRLAKEYMDTARHLPSCSINDFWGGPDSDYCNCGLDKIGRAYSEECQKIREAN